MGRGRAHVFGPGAGAWETGSPEDYGLDTAELDAARDSVAELIHNRNCFMVVRDGVIVYEDYFNGAGSVDTVNSLWSATKTFAGALTARADQQGHLDIDDPLTDHVAVEDIGGTTVHDATLEWILSMCAQSEDCAEFEYDGGGSRNLLNLEAAISSATGMSTSDYWETELRSQLGISDGFTWDTKADGTLPFGFGAKGTCRDMARLGQLHLNYGKWKDENGEKYRLISKQYVKRMVGKDPHPQDADGALYGYLTWYETQVNPPDEVTLPGGQGGVWEGPWDLYVPDMNGFGAQCVFMDFKTNTLLVTMGWDTQGWGCARTWQASVKALRRDEHRRHGPGRGHHGHHHGGGHGGYGGGGRG